MTGNESTTEPERRRRRRPAVSCTLCRKRKIRCDRNDPCSNCQRSRNAACVYDVYPNELCLPAQHTGQATQVFQEQAFNPSASVSITRHSSAAEVSAVSSPYHKTSLTGSTSVHPIDDQSSAWDVASLKSKVSELEKKLSQVTQIPPQHVLTADSPHSATLGAVPGDGSYTNYKSQVLGQFEFFDRSIMHKARLFGQSHWGTGILILRDIFEALEPEIHNEQSKLIPGLARCKQLARIIKSQRACPWPPSSVESLPPKNVADELLDCYLRTTESMYRIVHIPTFRTLYESFWTAEAQHNPMFLVQLKLILAIGATTYDEQFSMRASAIRWVYEAFFWMSEPRFKSRLTLHALQAEILLILAREMVGIGEGQTWISVGTVLRTAIHMGLHRDPFKSQTRTQFVAEMRRRLWNTILEINLHSSMASGEPPLLATDDFDTQPPGNFDDDQITTQNSVPKPSGFYTQTSIAIALRESYPVRLAVVKSLNDVGHQGTYEDTLKLDQKLRESFRALRRSLKAYSLSAGEPSPSSFQLTVMELIMHRYLSAIHVPFFDLSLQKAAYAFSRKVVVDSSLKIWSLACPELSSATASSPTEEQHLSRSDLKRLARCGSGSFRTLAFQAGLIVAIEVRQQLQEDEGLGDLSVRSDLLCAFSELRKWSLDCIEAGETNIKGFLVTSLVAAHIDNLQQGTEPDDLQRSLIEASEASIEKCRSILERQAGRSQMTHQIDAADQISQDMPTEASGGDSFAISNFFLDFDDIPPIDWMLDGEAWSDMAIE